ncbi:MAG: ThuA domain-containing protein [Oscillospiraceae bacterium]|jgi:trehalose utilization protein|nr:ThuA domain-containing protein [Oscillospiraceae bacterium]
MPRSIRVTIFCEHNQDRREPVKSVYPDGIHGALAAAFPEDESFAVTIATQDMPEHGLTEEVLSNTDTLVWWSHLDNPIFDDAVAKRVCRHVVGRGMGFLVLHSSTFSKPWQWIMGIAYDAGLWGRFRTMPKGEKERLWLVNPGHPIADGIGPYVEIPRDEMYGEPMLIPEPDQTIFLGWWEGGEANRAGCVFFRGRGKIFMFTPGHEAFPIFYQPEIQKILRNAARYLAPSETINPGVFSGQYLDNTPLEDLSHRK